MVATVRLLSRNPSNFSDPYKKLQELLLRSYGLSAAQMMSRWLDYPMSVMWDNLTALQPATVKEAQTVLFLCKLLRHIRYKNCLRNSRPSQATPRRSTSHRHR